MDIINKILSEISSYAARTGDPQLLMLLRKAVSVSMDERPDIARTISSTIGKSGGLGAARKFNSMKSVPADKDTGLALLVSEGIPHPDYPVLLDEKRTEQIKRFILERKKAPALLNKGILPPSSIALVGPPGTGKTSIARLIAQELSLPLFVLNLSSVITSYLGQTGQNIASALSRAKQEPSVLLLDEFESIGSIRSIDGDVGEMRRIVAVLLKEIEDWPSSGVIIATSNLPDLIDSAFIRRFSRWVVIPLPDEQTRIEIIKLYLPYIPSDIAELCAKFLSSSSGADLKIFSEKVKIREILDELDMTYAVIKELITSYDSSKKDDDIIEKCIKIIRGAPGKKISYRELGALFGISHTKARQLAER